MISKQSAKLAVCLGVLLFVMTAGLLAEEVNRREFGFGGGGSIYQEKSFTAPAGSANTGFDHSFGAGVWFGHELYRYVSGEVGYLYENNSAKLLGEGDKVTLGARSHTVYYDVLLHTAPRESKVRLFFSVGAGVKGYSGAGTESSSQPLQDYAVLTKTSEWKPMVAFGGGVKIRASQRITIRAQLKDYLTPFPKEVIMPVDGADLGGWIHNLVPMVGIGITF